MKNGTLLAAIDLGSNSFRLEICRYNNGLFQRYEYLKEAVRQGSGLDNNRNLDLASMQKGWDCLSRFAEKLAGFDPSRVRAVATQTLREARNAQEFLDKANHILGFPIEVVSGREEARLIYQGVAQLLPSSSEKRLVVDIGGRSTEFIIGENKTALALESYRIGSVSSSLKHFASGEFSHAAFEQAEVAAKAILEEALPVFGKHAWQMAYGSSGTVSAVSEALVQAGWPADCITREGVEWLKSQLIRVGHVDRLRLEGLKEERRAVIGGGLSVLSALIDLFDIQSLWVTPGALRHGVLHDLLNREDETKDIRAVTVSGLRKTYQADAAQALRVSKWSLEFLKTLLPAQIPEGLRRRLENKLKWAAHLHEIGHLISHTDGHKHGAYILENTDTPGFARHELQRLSQLVLGQKGKLRKLEVDLEDDHLVCQLLSLRMAVILCHARRDPESGSVWLERVHDQPRTIWVRLKPLWSKRFPQSHHLLQQEVLAWQKTSWKLVIVED